MKTILIIPQLKTSLVAIEEFRSSISWVHHQILVTRQKAVQGCDVAESPSAAWRSGLALAGKANGWKIA
ncbi:hypothetical protein EVAR_64329_1 [Eumeta japonica]|uniref:Uncharacterized protein n=1 Tax=Eumeta variegata TaxID=151549 RepID=A0A4C1ZBA3_EUMVA|nr:hypothetical protein EVAR_64329_1 [Eumeta japonica]